MKAYWNMGFPGWRIAAGCGMPIRIRIDVCRDEEAGVYFATSDDLGLAVESASLDELIEEIHAAIPVLLEAAHTPVKRPKAEILFHDGLVAA